MKTDPGLWLGGGKFRSCLKLNQLYVLMDVVGIKKKQEVSSMCSRFLGTKVKVCDTSNLSIRFLHDNESQLSVKC